MLDNLAANRRRFLKLDAKQGRENRTIEKLDIGRLTATKSFFFFFFFLLRSVGARRDAAQSDSGTFRLIESTPIVC
jgi:hypothetical protein